MEHLGRPDVQKLEATKNIDELIKALGYPGDIGVRRAAAEALGAIGDARAVEPLIAALKDGGRTVCQAAEALDKLGWKPDQGTDGVFYWMAKREWERCVQIGVLAVEPLLAAQKDDEYTYERLSAAKALAKIGDARAIEPLLVALKDEDYYVRKAAVEALGAIGAPAVEPLIAALKDDKDHVRQAAAEALDKLGWKPDQGTEETFYWIAKREWERCVQIGAPAVEPLIAALKDKNTHVCQAAAEALDKLGWKPDQGTDGVFYWMAKSEWERCVQIGAPAVEPLIAVLKDDKFYMRQAAEALGAIGDARAVRPLIAALKHEVYDVRKAAAEALVALYRAGRLGVIHRLLVLSGRSRITKQHYDHRVWNSSDCGFEHTDSGIGVEFPLL